MSALAFCKFCHRVVNAYTADCLRCPHCDRCTERL